MLLGLLKNIFSKKKPIEPDSFTPKTSDLPIERLHGLRKLHEKSPMNFHIPILYGDLKIGGVSYLELFNSCLTATKTSVSPWKQFIRLQASLNLINYFQNSLKVEGHRIECGTFMGFSSLLMCQSASILHNSFTGKDFYMVDSFSGFSDSVEHDYIPVKTKYSNNIKQAPAYKKGDGMAPLEHVQEVMKSYPDATILKGWIPDIFTDLPETNWAFVHIDVDLYEPTRDCLKYFYSRLSKGGVIVCDDYGSTLFPGAQKAWDEFFKKQDLPFIVLETGQSVFVK